MKKPKIIITAGIKGGIGKTGVCFTLARRLAQAGARVLTVDHDPQGSLTSYFLPDLDPGAKISTPLDIMAEHTVQTIKTGLDGIEHIPAHLEMIHADFRLSRDPSAIASYRDMLPLDYDFIVIDTGPALGGLLLAALYAADVVLSPVQPDTWTVQGLFMLKAELDRTKRRGGGKAELYAVPAICSPADAAKIRAWLPDMPITATVIPKSASVRRAALRREMPAPVIVAAVDMLAAEVLGVNI